MTARVKTTLKYWATRGVRPFPVLTPFIDVLWSIHHGHFPTRPYSSSDSSIPVDVRVPACRSLIPSEAISRIEAIITNNGDTKLTDCLPEGAAQTFIDSMQEVHLHIPSLSSLDLIVFALFGSFTFNTSGLGSS